MKALSLIATTALLAANTAFAAPSTLKFDVYNADDNSFNVNSTVVYGDTEAMVVDAGFTKADALRIAAKVMDSGKELKTIFISQADPDYYFGAEVLHALFPKAQIITTPAVKAVIEKKLAGKIAFWGPKMGANAPVNPVVPSAYNKDQITLDGHTIDIRGTTGELAHRPYLWIADSKALLGNVAIFGDLHAWTADTQTDESMTAWTAQLDEMLALNPEIVVPGHMKAGTELTTATITHTQDYLKTFNEAKTTSSNSAELIEKMMAAYPAPEAPLSLNIGAKVHMGEMKW